MTIRALPGLLLLLLVGLPTSAQEIDAPTGLAPAQSNFSVDDLPTYIRTIDQVTTDFAWDTSGDSRRELNTGRLEVHARWERPRNGGTPVLVGAEIRARHGRLHLAGHEINKITIDRNGVIRMDRKGIDAKIYKITQRANGDLVLDLPWYLLGDQVIKKEDIGDIELEGWPPSLENAVKIMTALVSGDDDDSDQSEETRHEGTFTWKATGRTRPSPLPFGDRSLEAATHFDVRGAARLEPDGSFNTIGDRNTATVSVQVGASAFRGESGNVEADVRSGQGRFSGRYAIAMPAEQGFSLTVDGDVSYAVDAEEVTLRVPSGTRVRAADARLSGDGRLVGSFGAGESSVVLRDGTYRLDLDGPITINRLRVGKLTVDELTGEGGLSSTGTLEELSGDRLAFRGSAEGDLDVRSRGIRGALAGEDAVETDLGRGSRLHFDLEGLDVETTLPGSEGRDVRVHAEADRGTLTGSLGLERTRVRAGEVTTDLDRVEGDFDLEVEGLSLDADEFGFRRARGGAGATITEGGDVTYSGLPGAPVIPAGARKHRVARGDTLHALARKYGVPVDRIRAANGIPAGSSLIRAGETLTIPGSGPAQPAPADVRGHWTTEVRPGSSVDLELDDAALGPDGLKARGTVAAKLFLSGSDVRAGSAQAKILGAARAALPRTDFTLDGERIRLDTSAPVRVPVRISLDPGSTVKVDVPGRETDLTFDRAGSYAEFVVSVVRRPDGQLTIDELSDCDLLLRSDGVLTSAGEVVDVSGSKTIRYTGRMAFVPGGIDFYGKITVEVEGDAETPAVRIRW